jgi:hypothetical protein
VRVVDDVELQILGGDCVRLTGWWEYFSR